MDDRGDVTRIHLGLTRLAASLAGGATDGLAVYGRHLLEGLAARDDLAVSPFGFGTPAVRAGQQAIRPMPGSLRQAAPSLLGLPGFPALDR
ncbi:MAG: hypothetical protein ACOC00_07245, partial [Halothiobacillaceae bacterium]